MFKIRRVNTALLVDLYTDLRCTHAVTSYLLTIWSAIWFDMISNSRFYFNTILFSYLLGKHFISTLFFYHICHIQTIITRHFTNDHTNIQTRNNFDWMTVKRECIRWISVQLYWNWMTNIRFHASQNLHSIWRKNKINKIKRNKKVVMIAMWFLWYSFDWMSVTFGHYS